jgi:hypothetical protein
MNATLIPPPTPKKVCKNSLNQNTLTLKLSGELESNLMRGAERHPSFRENAVPHQGCQIVLGAYLSKRGKYSK